MNRFRILIAVLITGVIFFSGHPPVWGQPGGRGRGEGPPPHGRMQGAPQFALWHGTTYLLAGDSLRKFDKQLKVAATVELPPSPSIDKMHEMMKQQRAKVPEESGEATPGERPGRDQGRERGMGMRHAGMMMAPSLLVDDTGVYVYAAGQIFSFDHDLKQRAVADVVPLVCPMPGMGEQPE